MGDDKNIHHQNNRATKILPIVLEYDVGSYIN